MIRNRTLYTVLFTLLIILLPLPSNGRGLGGGARLEGGSSISNGIISRVVECVDGHVATKSYTLVATGTNFVSADGCEFSFSVNDMVYTGNTRWSNIEMTSEDSIMTIRMDEPEGRFSVCLTYRLFPGLPVVAKTITITNTGSTDLCLESVDVEHLHVSLSPIESWVMRQYARHKTVGTYIGNWEDPLLIVHDTETSRGMAIGTEAIGVIKRTSAFHDGKGITAGVTHKGDTFAFRKWLSKGEKWDSPSVFTALYDNCSDPSVVLNTTIPDYVRRHMNLRIEQIARKPQFVYNTWYPFMRDIDDTTVCELAKAAAACGIEEFVIDDGWQLNIDSPADHPEFMGDWTIDRKKFPRGLKPVFDYIKSLGMKPGLWISLATADKSSKPYQQHPEWFAQDADGNLTDLHNEDNTSRTACFGTDWYEYIKNTILGLYHDYGLAYVKLDLAVLASAYIYNDERTGCYATDHPLHRDREESFGVIYDRCMALFDELHKEAPELFIDCTFETAGKFHLMDFGLARHAEGNWLSNVPQYAPVGSLRIRDLAWERCPALPATSLVIGNLRMEDADFELDLMSLAGTLPIMLGDPRQLSAEQRCVYRSWTTWLKSLEQRHGYMSYRQDLPGFGQPQEGAWDGFLRINTDTRSGGLIGVFRQGAAETTRTVTIPYLDADATYTVTHGYSSVVVAEATGKQLAEQGFTVTLNKKYDGQLFEVKKKN